MAVRRRTHREPAFPWLRVVTLGAVLLLAAGRPAAAQDTVTIRGEVGQTVGFALEDHASDDPGWSAGQVAVNRTHYRLEFERRFGYDAAGLLSLKGYFDAGASVVEQLAGAANGESGFLELDQAFVDLYSESTDFRIGRQKIAWGTADGFNPTSYFAPVTLDLAGGEVGTLVAPATALRSATYFNVGTLSVVVVPTFERLSDGQVKALWIASASEEGEPWTRNPDTVDLPALPSNQGEIGLQFDTFFRGTSLYLSYFNGYEDQPAAWLTESAGTLKVEGAWRRQQKAGVAAATTWRGFTLWGEATYTVPGQLPPESSGGTTGLLSPADPYAQAVLGGDYRLAGGLRLELQYVYNGSGSLLRPYEASPARAGQYLVGMASYAPAEAHSLDLVALDGLRDDSLILMPTYRYKLTQTTEVSLGAVVVSASADSEFGDMSASDQATLAVTVKF
ncbi:hypothetical protein [Limnochorda pilosa]|uniref:Porin domain-containing protein n=1 Tax=Limnochorda pilosa TaxID=1555112 RepID=A0A0K2SMZ0_LIMPI|nr:hypothetical protein [Limnochorda pilosa]BAS28485.1 hypothetical protein LIP_2655 [Limnochorda pilosa]